jgi:hypothetical protein
MVLMVNSCSEFPDAILDFSPWCVDATWRIDPVGNFLANKSQVSIE